MSVRICLFLTLGLSALLIVLPGCHSRAHLMHTPTLEEDLKLQQDELSSKFFDIDRYKSKPFPFFSFYNMPHVYDLKYGCYFGAAESKSFSLWNFCPFFALPLPLCPVKNITWEKGYYRFNVTVMYPLIYAFEPHIWYWEVEEIDCYPYERTYDKPDESHFSDDAYVK